MFGLYCRLNENNIILACVIPERLETIVSRILRWWLSRSNYSSILAILEKLLKRKQHVSYGCQLILHQPDRPHQPTTQSTSEYRISPQNTPYTAECTPTSHQERTPSKVCLLPRQWWDRWTCPVSLPTVRQHQNQTTASSTKYTQSAIWIHYATATNSHLQYVSHEQTWRDCPKSGGPRKVKGKR